MYCIVYFVYLNYGMILYNALFYYNIISIHAYYIHMFIHRLSTSKTIVVFTHSEPIMRCASIVHVIGNGGVITSGTYDQVKDKLFD